MLRRVMVFATTRFKMGSVQVCEDFVFVIEKSRIVNHECFTFVAESLRRDMIVTSGIVWFQPYTNWSL